METRTSLFGVAAEFDSAEHVLEAAKRIRAEGYRRAEAYTPYAVHGLADLFDGQRSGMPTIVMGGALIGAIGGFFMLWFANVISYPWDIGGRPPNSWPAFIPITFELAVLGAGLSATFGMFIMNGLPQPHHPMFNLPGFEGATRDRFFICIQANDPKFELETTKAFLQDLGPIAVSEVPMRERMDFVGSAGTPADHRAGLAANGPHEYVRTLHILALALLSVLTGCKEDNMSRQPRYKAYEPSEFFADGASARPVPAGTVPREMPDEPEITLDPAIPISAVQAVGYGGVPVDASAADNALSATIPFPITRAVIDRGQQRFDIYCAVCHGRLGNGEGMVVQRGFLMPPSFHIDRLRSATDQHFYSVMTNGYGGMFGYAERVAPEDRWMIVAYIRALQTAGESPALSPQTKAELYGTGEGVHIEKNPVEPHTGEGPQ